MLEVHGFCLGCGHVPASYLWSLGSVSLSQVSQTSHRLLHVSDMAGPETTPEGKEIP